MTESASLSVSRSRDFRTLVPYLAIGLLLFGFLIFALRVPLFEPVTSWVMSQGLLVEKILGAAGFWGSRLFLLVAYEFAAVVAWLIVEPPGRGTTHVWRRAVLSWLALQLLYAAGVAALVAAGVLYE